MRDFDWQIIVTLHQTLSITKTAELMFLSQSALTKRIKAIEDELGVVLLIRTRQGSIFTPEGERIAKKAENVLSVILEIKDEVSSLSAGKGGSLRLGFPYSFVRHVLPSILKQYTALYPNIDMQIFTMPSQELIKCVEAGNIDVCFARYNAEDSTLDRQLLSEDQACVVCDHPFSLDDLVNMPCIEFSKNPGTESAIQRWWDERFDSPQNVRFRVTTSDACVSMIKNGLGYGYVLDSRYIKDESGLWSIPLEYKDGTKLTRKTWIFYRKESMKNPNIRNFVEMLD